MTRTKQILALLVGLVTLAVLAPTAGAATTPAPHRYADPDGFRWSSVDPTPRFSPNPLRHVSPQGLLWSGSLEPTPRFSPKPRFSPNGSTRAKVSTGRLGPNGACYRC